MSDNPKAPWQTDEGKPVEVDQCALIYKVLARYPGEFSLFRELLQNSDDARSSTVEIRFETAMSREADDSSTVLLDMKSSDIVKWTFKNDGKQFTREDWARLAKIAKGNPDSATVGAFGVGFYSLFSVTDHPVVSSGGYGMEFYWKDDMDQLFVRQGDLPSDGTPSTWTIFEIPLREPGPMPEAIDLMRFLATSITFMAHLKDVGVFFNDYCIGHIKKFPEPAEASGLPIAFNHSSPQNTMVVDGLQCHRFRILAETSIEVQRPSSAKVPCGQYDVSSAGQPPPYLGITSLRLPAGDPAQLCTVELDLTVTVFTVEVDVKINEKFAKELSRCITKKPSSRLKYSLVYTGKEEYDQSFVDQEHQPLMSIFRGLRADLNKALDPRIFIGHSTSQTTGIGGHMASPFIPTVERESIDLVDKNVAVWNRELLHIGGLLCRAVYELELSAIETLWEQATESRDAIRQRFIHVLKFFTFHHSTPSLKVGQLLQYSFYACSTSPLRLLSSIGVRYASDIRWFDSLCDKFLKHVPMLSRDVTQAGKGIIEALPDEHKIRTIMLSDVLQDLRMHTLHEAELVACLQWQIQHGSTGIAELFQVACFWSADGKCVKLSSIQHFIDSSGPGGYLPSGGPLPPSVIPVEITKHFTPAHFQRFGWREFTIVDWLRYISQPDIRSANPAHDFVQSIEWAESVLHCVSSIWSSSKEIRELAKSVFGNEKCIPTMHGLCKPEDLYLPSLNNPTFYGLNLPVVWFPSGHRINAEMERLLIALGVLHHLPPRLLLTQMVETGKWKTSDLIDYLIQVAPTLTSEEISELKSFNAFAKEGAQTRTGRMHFRADELYPPIDGFRQLHLPLIEWGEKSEWQDTTPEAKLLYRLGLRRFPPLEAVIDLCSQDSTVGTNAFDYLCTNLQSVYRDSGYDPDNFRDIAFVRAENAGGPCLAKLGEVFLDNRWKALGFLVIQHRHRERILEELGVQRHPPSALIFEVLKTRPPSNEEIARQWFEILSNHVSNFSQHELDSLAELRIVPKTVSGDRTWLTPIQCYLGKSTKHDLYSKLFHFVNFGAGANQFLRACRAKNEPTEEDVAESLVDNHEMFYKLAGDERFLQELHDLAARRARISNCTISKMRSKPVLLGVRREQTMDTDGWKNTYSLSEPREIIIVDDIDTYQLFGDLIIAAPRDMPSELEKFYMLLGCRRLTTVVRDQCNASGEKDATTYSEFRSLILQRISLFLHHYPHPGTSLPRFSTPNDITVRVWEHLSVTKTLVVGNKKTPKEQSVWATAKYEQGTIQVWLSHSAKQDMYELAVSLCRVLFGTVNLSDALLLTTILSENLDVLKKRGYEVDHAFRRQEYPNDPRLTTAKNPCSSIAPEMPGLPPNVNHSITQYPVTEADLGPKAACARPATNHTPHFPEGSVAAPGSLVPSSGLALTVSKVTNNIYDAFRVATRSIGSDIEPAGTTAPILPPSPWDSRQVMPRSYIQSIVNKSIQACKSRQHMSLHHRRDADMTKFLNEGYCDISEPIEDLQFRGQMENIDVYTSRGIPNVDTFMEHKQEPLAHFVRIITLITKIYDLPTGSLRIFYDTTAGCIAFNCKGILYLNLRYFEAWHYNDVKQGNPRRALSSWFLTLAHEIAHNIVPRHDSEHEFWFWAICEAHMDAFLQLSGAPASD